MLTFDLPFNSLLLDQPSRKCHGTSTELSLHGESFHCHCSGCLEFIKVEQLVKNHDNFETDLTDLGKTMHDFLSFLVDMESHERIDRLKRKALSILQAISQASTFMEHHISKRFVGAFK